MTIHLGNIDEDPANANWLRIVAAHQDHEEGRLSDSEYRVRIEELTGRPFEEWAREDADR
jgi:hypothetical protein